MVSIVKDKPSRPLSANGKQYCKCVKHKCTKIFSCIAADVNCVVACKCSVKLDKCARVLDSENDDDQ